MEVRPNGKKLENTGYLSEHRLKVGSVKSTIYFRSRAMKLTEQIDKLFYFMFNAKWE